jgi:hypothetical protein
VFAPIGKAVLIKGPLGPAGGVFSFAASQAYVARQQSIDKTLNPPPVEHAVEVEVAAADADRRDFSHARLDVLCLQSARTCMSYAAVSVVALAGRLIARHHSCDLVPDGAAA